MVPAARLPPASHYPPHTRVHTHTHTHTHNTHTHVPTERIAAAAAAAANGGAPGIHGAGVHPQQMVGAAPKVAGAGGSAASYA